VDDDAQRDAMIAAAAMDRYLKAEAELETIRNPALIRLARRLGSAPKAADAVAAELAHLGWTPDAWKGRGIAGDNIRRLVREAGQ
jgi:hypothetical protein